MTITYHVYMIIMLGGSAPSVTLVPPYTCEQVKMQMEAKELTAHVLCVKQGTDK
jgi:hypothetical protein